MANGQPGSKRKPRTNKRRKGTKTVEYLIRLKRARGCTYAARRNLGRRPENPHAHTQVRMPPEGGFNSGHRRALFNDQPPSQVF